MLKPGGLFLWGNALPTRVWLTAEKELTGLGFDRLASLCGNTRTRPALSLPPPPAPLSAPLAGSLMLRVFAFILPRNHTAGAVVARDEDEDRVNSYAAHLYAQYPLAFKMPVRGAMCEKVVDRLLLNFYRHPGTALYLKMVTGYDSYMHEVYQKPA